MNATQLEALVLQAVDAVKAGVNPEDDRIEFKRDWPGIDKARQLAAAANQARGDHIIYVIGVDDKTGIVHPLDGTDPATWWAQFEARFDEVAPELVRHVALAVSPEERVVALLFRTDRAPYLVKVGAEGGGQLEVPIRAGTRTRSAKRHELLRMLYPAVHVPQISAIAAALYVFDRGYSAPPGALAMSLWVKAYFDSSDDSTPFLPYHLAHAEAIGGEFHARGEVFTDSPPSGKAARRRPEIRTDGVAVGGPGTAPLYARWFLPIDAFSQIRAIARWRVRLALPVSGTDKIASLEIDLGNQQQDVQDGRRREAAYAWSLYGDGRRHA
ncbi:ATP-binding protein [Microbacterium sp. LWH10-1.2]|uniref:AlbA family DNA-binding domain-containing protein n=1 Tax=Microbacterium sp. LWH10-1.2 TaxID=3135255 RepID=UPI003138A5C3